MYLFFSGGDTPMVKFCMDDQECLANIYGKIYLTFLILLFFNLSFLKYYMTNS